MHSRTLKSVLSWARHQDVASPRRPPDRILFAASTFFTNAGCQQRPARRQGSIRSPATAAGFRSSPRSSANAAASIVACSSQAIITALASPFPINIWLDDSEQPNDDWLWVRNINELAHLLMTFNQFGNVSLDPDLEYANIPAEVVRRCPRARLSAPRLLRTHRGTGDREQTPLGCGSIAADRQAHDSLG